MVRLGTPTPALPASDVSRAKAPIVSGAESFIAGTASCSIEVEGADELYAHCKERDVVHPKAHLEEKPWGTRELGVLDPDGNLVSFWEPA